MLGSFWESNLTKRLDLKTHDGRELQHQVCVCVRVCCHRMNVHQSIQPCLHSSLTLVIYSQAEQGRAFETAPGGTHERGKGSSSSWDIDRHTHTHLTYLCVFIPTVVFVLGNLLLQPFSLVHMNTSTKHNQAGRPPYAGTRVCEEVREDLSVCVPFAFSFMQYISLSAAGPS